MTKTQACGLCGRSPATGFGEINGVRYCHDEESPTCYERAQMQTPALATLVKMLFGYEGPLDVQVIRPLLRTMVWTGVEPVAIAEVPGPHASCPWPPQQCSGAVYARLEPPERCAYPEGHDGPCEP